MRLLTSRSLLVTGALILVLVQILALAAWHAPWLKPGSAAADEIGNDAFWRTWARTDFPVAESVALRTWMWGPSASTPVVREAYAESPGGARVVQYFDKSRMEITDPGGDRSAPWYVTNGLLVVELVTGRLQLGDNRFEQRVPAQVNVAGDPDPVDAAVPLNSPTYATFGQLRDDPPSPDGALITRRLARDGAVTDDPSLAGYGVTAAYHVQQPGIDHQVASPFWTFMGASATVYDVATGAYVDAPLFENPFYATGLPITDAYWANVPLAGVRQDVLVQCFERRCLTYTPGNPAGWQVEAGNVGLHYHQWRYPDDGGSPTPMPSATAATPTQTTATATPTATRTPVPTNTPQPTSTPTTMPTATSTPVDSSEAACLNAEEEAFLALINGYRADRGLAPLENSRKLNIAAYGHSLDMGTRNYFSHSTPSPLPPGQSGPSFTDRMEAAGYTGWTTAAENIAGGHPTAEAVFNAWKGSSGHNANMLKSNATQIGIGFAVVQGSQYTNYWTTDFANGNDSAPGC